MKKIIFIKKPSLIDNPVFLNGISRSGKFFLGKIISTFKNTEYFQYILVLDHIPFMERLDSIREDAAISLLRVNVDGHAYNMRIGRNLNFRFDDSSSVSNSPESEAYRRRSLSPISKKIAEEMKAEDRNYPFVLHENLCNVKIFFKAFPHMRWINLMRHPVDIVSSWYLRGWGRRHGTDPLSLSPTINGPTQPVPWFACGWEEEYEASTEIDRVIKSVAKLIEMDGQTYRLLTEDEKSQILLIRYENVVENTNSEIGAISSFLNTEPSEDMPLVLARERCPRKIPPEEREQKKENIRGIASKEAFDLMMRLASEYETRKNPYQDIK